MITKLAITATDNAWVKMLLGRPILVPRAKTLDNISKIVGIIDMNGVKIDPPIDGRTYIGFEEFVVLDES